MAGNGGQAQYNGQYAARYPAASVEVVGESEAFLAFQEALARAAAVDRPVLLAGERGTGKELAAARLHFLSPRWGGPLQAVNCAALAPTLLEDELFGHEAGAFTGAAGRRAGRFEAAEGGTLFLDEIGALSLAAQEKMLRVVEYGVFERLGGTAAVRVDVRLVGASNADLPLLAEQGRFKRDLLDRLSFLVLTLPPLRARDGDALLLAVHFARRFALETGRDEPRFSPSAEARLAAHSWPGNVRELKSCVERSVFAASGDVVEEIVLDPFASPWREAARRMAAREAGAAAGGVEGSGAAAPHVPASPIFPGSPGALPSLDLATPLPEQVDRLKVALCRAALARARHNRRAAAGLLGLSYDQLRALLRRYGDRILEEPRGDGAGTENREPGKTGSEEGQGGDEP
ncbi:response regulator receiver protein [Desulfovibrio sp. X2]|uniref:sigma 54-interacting transcriptional regulator n=1 Tax=Desulfovibrio sp. X2 TaxID=941449 RepID=UPI000358CE33|nr:sigma 54-interacting transcriptional regulator [Desulfovibrio sp. X2]EPR41819.1 response regulator receiver protein [Desulfovibrio sp. X2]